LWFDLKEKNFLGSEGTIERAIRDDYLPHFTHFGSRRGIIGNMYWTENALQNIEKLKRVIRVKPNLSKEEKLQHEHIVPRNKICDTLLNSRGEVYFTKNFVSDILTYYAKGVTITKKEHDLLRKDDMPDDFYDVNNMEYFYNPWARYKLVPEIKVFQVSWVKIGNEYRDYNIGEQVDYSKWNWRH
jgi:hypothetical protein